MQHCLGKESALRAGRVALIKSLIYAWKKERTWAQGCQIQLKMSADMFNIQKIAKRWNYFYET